MSNNRKLTCIKYRLLLIKIKSQICKNYIFSWTYRILYKFCFNFDKIHLCHASFLPFIQCHTCKSTWHPPTDQEVITVTIKCVWYCIRFSKQIRLKYIFSSPITTHVPNFLNIFNQPTLAISYVVLLRLLKSWNAINYPFYFTYKELYYSFLAIKLDEVSITVKLAEMIFISFLILNSEWQSIFKNYFVKKKHTHSWLTI